MSPLMFFNLVSEIEKFTLNSSMTTLELRTQQDSDRFRRDLKTHLLFGLFCNIYFLICIADIMYLYIFILF